MESVIVAAVDFEHTVRESTGIAMTGIPWEFPGMKTNEWLRERTEHLDIFLFSAHHSIVFYFRCSVYWWKGSVRF